MTRAVTRATSRPVRKPKAARETQSRASLVFRDFVRQLEKIDAGSPKGARGVSR